MNDLQLNESQERLFDLLQSGISLCERPFEELADRLNVSEREVLDTIACLKKHEFIRRFRGQIDYRKLGRAATLAAAKVPAEKIEAVGTAVSSLPGVSHNYLRDHEFNLWFTVQDTSYEAIHRVLKDLELQTGTAFYSFPAVKRFKLDVRFGSQRSSQGGVVPLGLISPEAVVLSAVEKTTLRCLQQEVPLVSRPFETLAKGISEGELLCAARSLREKGVLQKIATAANQYRMGYQANAMFCAAIPAEYVDEVGLFLAKYKQVSHCYERQVLPDWPYNLYAMIHVHTDEMLRLWVEELVRAVRIRQYTLLRTVKELKKEPVFLRFL